MKNLHEIKEETWQFNSQAMMSGVIREVPDPREIFLLLHGLNERGKKIFRKLNSYLPSDALILAPNGIFPLADQNESGLRLGYTWYYYDRVNKNYLIDQTQACVWLQDLVKAKNPCALPVTVIGFSQGGYLAPLAAKVIENCVSAIGIACEFRSNLITAPLSFHLSAVHGTSDNIIDIQMARDQIALLNIRNIACDFYPVEDAAHEITASMGKTIQTILEKRGKRSL